jgi:hypothetical protein
MNEMTRMAPQGVQMDPMTVAQVFKASGMFPDIQSEAAACTKIIIGRGLGLTDFDAMTGLHIIKGKAVLAANLMAASVKRAGKYDYRATLTDTACEITFFQRNDVRAWEEIGTTTFSMDDARRAQLGGDNWRKYPRNMLFARCISNGYKAFCPDALGAAPVYVEAHGEMEITDDAVTPTAVHVLPAFAPATEMPQVESEAKDAPKHTRKRIVKQEAAAAPQEAPAALAPAKPVDGYPDEYEGAFQIHRVVRRPSRPIAIEATGEHGKVWIATSVGEYADLAEDNVNGEMTIEVARIGQTMQVMRVVGPIKPVEVNPEEVPY